MARSPHALNTRNLPLEAYDGIRKWFSLTCALAALITSFINAPFGRFTHPSSRPGPIAFFSSPRFMVDGIRSWMLMEIVSPITFLCTLKASPLSFYPVPLPSAFSPQGLLATLFLIHYLNRAILSPLRTPSRSKAHVIVTLSAVAFNLCNGYLMGSYLSSPFARIYLGGQYAFDRPTFRIGVLLWVVGFVGNVVHDEILLDIRRKAQQKKKDEEDKDKDKKKETGEHYGIPSGLLYTYISYPNYFCEWIEWLGFALAASPLPLPIDEHALLHAPNLLAALAIILDTLRDTLLPLLNPVTWVQIVRNPASTFAVTFTPPWIFMFNEICTMLPRAIKGHAWYKERFGDRYPKERKAVIPFVL